MDTQQEQRTLAHQDYSSNVDTSRPFRSVKEAVAIFGERLILGEFYTTNINPSKEIISSAWKYPSPSPSPSPQQNPSKDDDDAEQQHEVELFDTLKKLEAELEETKMELKLLKEKESENEIALATLNAELHKNMSKLAEAEAEAAGAAKKAATGVRTMSPSSFDKQEITKEEEMMMKRELMIRMENSPTLAQILSIGENGKYYNYGGNKKERRIMDNYVKKKKPIVPLVTDFFFKKKGASGTTLQNPLCAAATNSYFN